MSMDRNEHFEVICTYLGSDHARPANKAALREEALAMLCEGLPTGEMIFSALFGAEDFDLLKLIHYTHGVGAFSQLDAFSMNTRSLWRTSTMEEDELSQVFAWVLEAWKEEFAADPAEALQYAIETNRCAPVKQILALVSPDRETLSRILLTRFSISRITPRNAEALLPLILEIRDEAQGWQTVLNYAFTAEQFHLRAVLLAARLGVDLTSIAQDLLRAHPSYRDFLISVSSQHGRIEMMKTLPSPEEIITMQSPELKRLLKNADALAA